MRLARTIGADVPVCLINRLAFMQGIGDRVKSLGLAARIPAVLVNPRTPLSTASVFAELAAPHLKSPAEDESPPQFENAQELIGWVAKGRNDLEAPALRLAPIIDGVRTALLAQPGCQVARLSGSGPTCFGIFETAPGAATAAEVIAREQPNWWVRATALS